jgi:hypothetical protein
VAQRLTRLAPAAQWQRQQKAAGGNRAITDSDQVKFASVPATTMILIRVAP